MNVLHCIGVGKFRVYYGVGKCEYSFGYPYEYEYHPALFEFIDQDIQH